MKLPAPEAPAADIISFVDKLEDECVNDPNRLAWDANKQRWLDLYTGNHYADAVVSLRDTGREPEELAPRTMPTMLRIVYNRVMNAVLVHQAAQVGNEPKVVFNARESGEPPIYYLNGYVQNPIVQQMAMQAGAQDPRVQELQGLYGGALPGQMEEVPNESQIAPQEIQPGDDGSLQLPATPGSEMHAPSGLANAGQGDGGLPGVGQEMGVGSGDSDLLQASQPAPVAVRQKAMHPEVQSAAQQIGLSIPLQEPFVSQLKAMIDQGKYATMQARMQGMPPPQNIIPPEALVEVTDQSKAQLRQTVYDALWEQCGGVECCNENILNKAILGWQPTLIEMDRNKIDIGESPITLTNVEGAQVYCDPMTSSYRQGRYRILREPVPVEEAIAKYPQHAEKLRLMNTEGTLGNRLNRNGASSRLGNIQFARDMCVIRTLWIRDWPYPLDPDEAVSKGLISVTMVPDESAIQSGMGAVSPAPVGGDAVSPEGGTADGQQLHGGGELVANANGQVHQPATRQAFIDTATGEEVTPAHPSWPTAPGIREIRDIEGEICFDQQCKLPDFPIQLNINIAQPYSPYGIGEPDRLDGLQMAINRVLSDLVQRHRYTAYPVEVRKQSIADARGTVLKKARLQPNSVVNIGEEDAPVDGDLSKVVQYLNLPPMDESSWKLLEFLVEAIDKEANNSEAAQGIAPSGTSGAWVANLQAASAQVLQVTSINTEAWLRKIVRQILYFIDHVMTVEDIQKYTSKYPPPILAALHSPQKSPYIDISVEIQSGSAAAKQGQTTAMIQAKQAGMGVSEPAILERMNLDPDNELKREGDFMQKKMEAGLVPLPAQEQEQPGKKPATTEAA